jgi:hypothetical protein
MTDLCAFCDISLAEDLRCNVRRLRLRHFFGRRSQHSALVFFAQLPVVDA